MKAVEWFAKQVLEYKSPTNINGTDYILIPVDKIEFLQEQAKEMEKEQIINAWNTRSKIDSVLTYTDNRTAEQYYNETYESNTRI